MPWWVQFPPSPPKFIIGEHEKARSDARRALEIPFVGTQAIAESYSAFFSSAAFAFSSSIFTSSARVMGSVRSLYSAKIF